MEEDPDLVKEFKAESVLGVDVEAAPCLRSKALVAKYNLEDRIKIKKIRPGIFPLQSEKFDIVFSKDSIVHIHDKEELASEVFRILKQHKH